MVAVAGSDLLPHLAFPVLQHEAGYQLAFVGQQISASHLSSPAQPPLCAGKRCLDLVGKRRQHKVWLSHVSPQAPHGRKPDLITKLLLTLLSGSELGNGSHLLWVCLRHVASKWAILCGLFSVVIPQFLSPRRQITGCGCAMLQAGLWSTASHQCCSSAPAQTSAPLAGAKNAQSDPEERRQALLVFELGGNKKHFPWFLGSTYCPSYCLPQCEDGLCSCPAHALGGAMSLIPLCLGGRISNFCMSGSRISCAVCVLTVIASIL